jgi:hypothetical protein
VKWEVHLDDPGDLFVRNRVQLMIYRRLDDGRTEVVFRDGSTHVLGADPLRDEEGLPAAGFTIPTDALEGLRQAIDKRLGQRYDESLVFELRQVLELERRRNEDLVGRLLDAALDYPKELLELGISGLARRRSAARPTDPGYTDEEPF